MVLTPGDRFERYTIEARLGEGGMGVVYRAHDPRLGRRVALKVLSGSDAGAAATPRLLREARAAAALDHPNAVSVFDVGEHDGVPFIVMELVDGRTLRTTVGDERTPVATRVAQLADVARALSAAHGRGVVHRDIKPENVMVRADGVVKVLDFGIARRAGRDADPHAATEAALPTLTADGVRLGTPVYMAPEQIRGDALDGRSDEFSWGVLAYEVLAGRLPWRGGGDALAAMASALTDPVERGPLEQAGVPAVLQDVVLRALEKRPADRFASMDDLLLALDAAAEGRPAPAAARPPSPTAEHRYSTGEVREVLGRALEQQARAQPSVKLGLDDLLAVAAEVGVDAGALRQAARAVRSPAAPAAPDLDAARRDAWLRRRRVALARHAGAYAIVCGALLVLGLGLLAGFTPWWVWFIPALAWGMSLALHAMHVLTLGQDDFQEHEAREQRRLERRRRWSGARPAAQGGLEARGGQPARVRVAPPTGEAPVTEDEVAAPPGQSGARRR